MFSFLESYIEKKIAKLKSQPNTLMSVEGFEPRVCWKISVMDIGSLFIVNAWSFLQT